MEFSIPLSKYMLEYCTESVNNHLNLYRISDKSTGISVSTLTNGGLTEQRAAFIAMSMAKFSRSAASFEDAALDIVDGSASMEKIAIGYGHASVAGMAHINMQIEEVSIFDTLDFFYSNLLIDGQERSTRYQNFDRFISIPSIIGNNKIRSKYKEIVKRQLSFYAEMYQPTYDALKDLFPSASASTLNIRTLDCTRYLLPLATKSSFGAALSARSLSRYISHLGSKLDPISTRLTALLTELFTTEDENTYKSECSFLIRHTNPASSLVPLINFLSTLDKKCRRVIPEAEPRVYGCSNYGLDHLMKLIDPSYLEPYELSADEEYKLGQFLAGQYDHHNECPPFLRDSFISVYGYADIGSIKDLNRHRSINKLVPFLHQESNMASEILDRPVNRRFFISPYLTYNKSMNDLAERYTSFLIEIYKEIESWYKMAVPEIGIYSDLYVKRLVPQAHATSFVYGGSYNDFNYLSTLRTKHGGHIQYRMLAYDMVKELAEVYPVYKSLLLDKLQEPDPTNEEQFKGRS